MIFKPFVQQVTLPSNSHFQHRNVSDYGVWRSALSQRGGAIPSCSPHPHAGRQRQARGAAPGRRPVAGDAHPGPGAVPGRGAPPPPSRARPAVSRSASSSDAPQEQTCCRRTSSVALGAKATPRGSWNEPPRRSAKLAPGGRVLERQRAPAARPVAAFPRVGNSVPPCPWLPLPTVQMLSGKLQKRTTHTR